MSTYKWQLNINSFLTALRILKSTDNINGTFTFILKDIINIFEKKMITIYLILHFKILLCFQHFYN